MFHFAGDASGFVAVAPEVVHAHRAFDGAAGILRHNQAVEAVAGFGVGGSDEEGCAERDVVAVYRARVFAHQGGAERADGAVAVVVEGAEEDVAGVLPQYFGQFLRVLLHIGFDALHGGLCQREVAAVGHVAADGDVGVFVFVGKPEADVFAGRGFQTAGTLYLKEEEFDGVVGIAEYRCFAVQRAAVDFVAGVVGDETAADKTAFEGFSALGDGEGGEVGGVGAVGGDAARVLSGLADADGGFAAAQVGGQVYRDEVVGDAVNGEAGAGGGLRVAVEDGFVIAGYGAAELAVFADLPGGEILFEEAAGGVVVALGLRGLCADSLPAGLVLQFFTAFEEGFEAFGEVLVGPLRQCGVIDGGVGRAAARRADGRTGGGALSCGLRGAVGIDRLHGGAGGL